MKNKLTKPKDHYSHDWTEYWKQNPSAHKSIGAAAAGDPPADPPADPLTIDPAEFAAMRDAVAKLEAKNKELLQEKSDAKKAAEKAAEEAARKSGDVEALEKSWKEKLEAETRDRDGRISEYQQMINRMTVGTEAQRMASAMALPGSADVLLPHIERRLSVEMKDGQAIVRVLGKDGKPSAMSLDDLRKEIEGNSAFAPLIVGSKASGSGGVGGKGGAPGAKTMSRTEFDALNPAGKMKFLREDKGTVVDA